MKFKLSAGSLERIYTKCAVNYPLYLQLGKIPLDNQICMVSDGVIRTMVIKNTKCRLREYAIIRVGRISCMDIEAPDGKDWRCITITEMEVLDHSKGPLAVLGDPEEYYLVDIEPNGISYQGSKIVTLHETWEENGATREFHSPDRLVHGHSYSEELRIYEVRKRCEKRISDKLLKPVEADINEGRESEHREGPLKSIDEILSVVEGERKPKKKLTPKLMPKPKSQSCFDDHKRKLREINRSLSEVSSKLQPAQDRITQSNRSYRKDKDRMLVEAQKAFDKLKREKISLEDQAMNSLDRMARLRPDADLKQECIKMKFVSKLLVPKSVDIAIAQQGSASNANHQEDFASFSTSLELLNDERSHESFDVTDSLTNLSVHRAEEKASLVQIPQSSDASRYHMETCFGEESAVLVKPSCSDTPTHSSEMNKPPPSEPYTWAYYRYLMGAEKETPSSIAEIWKDYKIN